jgi:arylsulfatase A-like enzyme
MKTAARSNARLLLPLVWILLCAATAKAADKPNILFIAMDDLNDWVGCLGGNPQSITPNLDRLAESGVLFTNAHCPGAACNPSRTAIMSGLSPHRSGLYANNQKMREVLPGAVILPQYFRNHGYRASGSGKMLHYFIDARSWDEYFPEKETENPFPRTLYPEKRPVSLPREPWQYVETDWAALDATDEEFGGDWLVTKWVGEQLAVEHEKPFFLACGIYRPHEPWFVPAKYFEPFPIDKIQLPPGYKEDDLDDLPPDGQRRGPNRYFAHIRAHQQWKNGIQGYLASIHFADAMLGRVLDALEQGPNRDSTIVVLWSDHGWHLGEKQHWQKFTAWRACTRIPFMIKVPPRIAPGLPSGTRPDTICDRPVNLLSLYPTLVQLAGLPAKRTNDGPSLVPLLKKPRGKWGHVSITHLDSPGNFGLSAQDWRYIHYANGDEELYHVSADPYEWNNLAADDTHAKQLSTLRQQGPSQFAPFVKPQLSSLPAIAWMPAGHKPAPPSNPKGNTFEVIFINRRDAPVELFWMDPQGLPRSYGIIEPDKVKRQSTRPGAVWQLAEPKGGPPLGHFIVGDRQARAVIPRIDNKK